ncbi:MAG TPA: isoamylase early set domain-containing protein [Gemmatimonadales bacterium]|jgi:hypothetical protein|nr:isoamylase early set domain-containing protein [Gemmatimonadales bacterium]
MTVIDPRVQEALDGERDPATLPAELREDYARLTAAAALLQELPATSVADRVMAEIREIREIRREAPTPQRSNWLLRPVTFRLRPVWTLAVAAAIAAVVFLPFPETAKPGAEEGVAQFVGHFPGARSVEVVGSFNDWQRGALALRDEDHDGIWHGAVVLPAGQHEYMFVVDGERWVADPLAGRYVDDGFGAGQQNALLIVRP